jgi:Zn-dependent protease
MFEVANLVYIIPAIIVSMGFHEAMHAFTAHWLGDTTASDMGRITLNPLKHIDIYMTLLLPVGLILLGLPPIFAAKPVPFNPSRVKYDEYGAALVGIAGPLTNLVLATFSALVIRLISLPELALTFMVVFCAINVSFFVFNMLPLPPLDGSRLLYAFAPESLQRVMYQIEAMGFMFLIVVLIVLAPIIGPFLTEANSAIVGFLLG